LLQTELDRLLHVKQTDRAAGEQGDDFLRRLQTFAGGGKLLRGCLVCFGYRAWSNRHPTKRVIDAALAIELAHGSLLIHDDIMDGDELRRGRPSMHRQYEIAADKRRLSDTAGFGLGMALSGGDVALLLAFELLGRTGNATAHQLFTDQLLQTCGGQMQDIYLGAANAEPDRPAIYQVMEQKTAGYTIALPLALGATLAGQPAPVLRKVQATGRLIGTIFQIRDDELGVLGSRRQTGKPVGADIRENKKTLLRYHLMRRCTADERRELAGIFGNPAATYADIRLAQGLFRSYKIPDLIAKEIENLRREAQASIKKLAIPRASEQALEALLAFCAERQF
jgi:geranylgeranyl diphosphate synthase type I